MLGICLPGQCLYRAGSTAHGDNVAHPIPKKYSLTFYSFMFPLSVYLSLFVVSPESDKILYWKELGFIEHLLCASSYALLFAFIISFSLHKSPKRQEVLLSPFLQEIRKMRLGKVDIKLRQKPKTMFRIIQNCR